jgi:hypothetical protein
VTTDGQSFYDLLHVSRDAPTEVIRASYRTLMQRMRMHPDLGGDAVTAAMINEAYRVLVDPDRRARYDQALDEAALPDDSAEPVLPVLDPYSNCLFCGTAHDYGRAIDADARCVACGSPLAPAGDERLESRDARAVARIPKRQEIEFFTRWPQRLAHSGRTEDVSLRGLRLVSDVRLEPGQVVTLRCAQFDAIARVANVRPVGSGLVVDYAAGLGFLTLKFNRSKGGFVSRRA